MRTELIKAIGALLDFVEALPKEDVMHAIPPARVPALPRAEISKFDELDARVKILASEAGLDLPPGPPAPSEKTELRGHSRMPFMYRRDVVWLWYFGWRDRLEGFKRALQVPPTGALWMGSGRLRIDGETIIVAADNDQRFIETLLDFGGAARSNELQAAGVSNPTTSCQRLMSMKGGILAPFFEPPKGRRNVGFATSIKDGRGK